MKKFLALFALFAVLIFAMPAMAQYYGRGGYAYYDGGYYAGLYNPGLHFLTGIKFHLDLIPKDQRKLIKNGIITIDGAEVGIVNQHDGFWNGTMVLCPGSHQIQIELEDGRKFETQVKLLPGQIIWVYPRFRPVE